MGKVIFFGVELSVNDKWDKLSLLDQQKLISRVRQGRVQPVVVEPSGLVIEGEEVLMAAICAKIRSLAFVVVTSEIQAKLSLLPPANDIGEPDEASSVILQVTEEQCQAWSKSPDYSQDSFLKKLDRFCVFTATPAELQRVLEAMQEIDPTRLTNRKMSAKSLIRLARAQKTKRLLAQPIAGLIRPGVDLRFGDFRTLGTQIEENSIDGIETDPPYDKASIDLYYESAKLAMRVLKPGGIYIAYAGKMFLPQVYAGLERSGLEFVWQSAIFHKGGHNVTWPRRMISGYKPIIIYRKPSDEAIQWPPVLDACSSGKQEQDLHPWQQALAESEYFIQKLFAPGSTILDPMMGSGTTIVAAINCGMNAVGIELDPVTFETAKKRIEDHLASLSQNIKNKGA